jgi:hypothetical protein
MCGVSAHWVFARRFVERFSRLADGERDETAQVSVAGRVWTKREQGQKLVFYDIRGDGHKIQAHHLPHGASWLAFAGGGVCVGGGTATRSCREPEASDKCLSNVI